MKFNGFSFSLFEAIQILLENHVHRLPIIDPINNNVVFILTHKRILRFFYLYVSKIVRRKGNENDCSMDMF